MTAVLILAGTRPGGDPFADALGVPHKSLIELEGKTLLARVVQAARDAGMDRIAVSCSEGPVAEAARSLSVDTIPAAAGPSASVALAFDRLGTPLVVTTSDHALLRGEWIRKLVETPSEGADLAVMLAEREQVETALPGSKRTYLRLADGHWSGCNLFYLKTPAARRAIDLWSMVEADRKRPWRIASRLGPGTLLAMLVGRLTMAEAIARLGHRIGLKAELVAATNGLGAVDIDKQSDLDTVRALLSDRSQGATEF